MSLIVCIQVENLIFERRWQELANVLCDLQTIRKFLCHQVFARMSNFCFWTHRLECATVTLQALPMGPQSAEDGILNILQLFNKACSALEMTAREKLGTHLQCAITLIAIL